MIEQQELEALRAVLAFAKAGWASRKGNIAFPPQFGIVQRVIDDQQRYLDNPVSLAVHCMGLFVDYLPFEMLAVLVVSDKHLSEGTMSMLGSNLEGDDDGEFESLQSFKLGKGNAAEFLIEVPGDDEDWEQEMPEDLFNLLQYAERRSCSWILLGAERGENQELPTFPAAGSTLRSE
jgi:hypothetical protein